MTCPACDKARTSCSALYQAACPGCTARAIARSLAAFNALDPAGAGDVQPLRDLVAKMMPETSTREARRMVMEWWQIDHAASAQQKGS